MEHYVPASLDNINQVTEYVLQVDNKQRTKGLLMQLIHGER
jgi:hypothetical protein